MPSISPKMRRFMKAIDEGWKPDRVDAPPKSVAHEFVAADEAKKKRKNVKDWLKSK